MIDGIDCFEGREATQEEFQRLLRHFLDNGTQLVTSSVLPPQDLSAAQLLTAGLIAKAGKPKKETLAAIAAHQIGQVFPDERDREAAEKIGRYLANEIGGNVREIKGAARRAALACVINGNRLDLSTALQIKESECC
jgi:chromosomal replication initiator protein